MIPTVIVVGTALGAFVHAGGSLVWCSVLGVVISLLWGVGVGVADASVATFIGATALAVVNLLVGAAVSTSLRSIGRTVGPRKRPAPH
jgi:hypothetical protein